LFNDSGRVLLMHRELRIVIFFRLLFPMLTAGLVKVAY
jgi:hypothetical protein